MTEGSQWEAVQLARHYRLDNLVGVLDVNRLEQRGETMYGHDLEAYQRRLEAFGWQTRIIDGHDMAQIIEAYRRDGAEPDRPLMIIARTLKGKGVSFLEDKDGWHGKALDEDQLARALEGLGEVDPQIRGAMALPEDRLPEPQTPRSVDPVSYAAGEELATRKAYGRALVRLYPAYPNIVVLDAEVSNSTYSETFKKDYPQRFFEMFIAEQNMAGAACGLAARGKIPFVSTFAAFQSRAFDQIRMSQYSAANIKFCGSHSGVAIGQDGPSQMGLEDIAMFRSLIDSVVLYPSDAVSTEKLVEEAARHHGLVYIRTTRNTTPVTYAADEEFSIGGCKVLKTQRRRPGHHRGGRHHAARGPQSSSRTGAGGHCSPGHRSLQHQTPGCRNTSCSSGRDRCDHHRGGPLSGRRDWRSGLWGPLRGPGTGVLSGSGQDAQERPPG